MKYLLIILNFVLYSLQSLKISSRSFIIAQATNSEELNKNRNLSSCNAHCVCGKGGAFSKCSYCESGYIFYPTNNDCKKPDICQNGSGLVIDISNGQMCCIDCCQQCNWQNADGSQNCTQCISGYELIGNRCYENFFLLGQQAYSLEPNSSQSQKISKNFKKFRINQMCNQNCQCSNNALYYSQCNTCQQGYIYYSGSKFCGLPSSCQSTGSFIYNNMCCTNNCINCNFQNISGTQTLKMQYILFLLSTFVYLVFCLKYSLRSQQLKEADDSNNIKFSSTNRELSSCNTGCACANVATNYPLCTGCQTNLIYYPSVKYCQDPSLCNTPGSTLYSGMCCMYYCQICNYGNPQGCACANSASNYPLCTGCQTNLVYYPSAKICQDPSLCNSPGSTLYSGMCCMSYCQICNYGNPQGNYALVNSTYCLKLSLRSYGLKEADDSEKIQFSSINRELTQCNPGCVCTNQSGLYILCNNCQPNLIYYPDTSDCKISNNCNGSSTVYSGMCCMSFCTVCNYANSQGAQICQGCANGYELLGAIFMEKEAEVFQQQKPEQLKSQAAEYTYEQLQFIYAPKNRDIKVTACAGSGKTQ
ncbi:hypothetical protein ABPG73_004593 [Tetrahymena malaccensis]